MVFHMDIYRKFPFDGLFILAVAVLSFLFYGLPFYRFLDSDMAVHVYMSESFSFRYNLYYWAQDRLGSIVPMTGHVLYRLFHITPAWACGLAKYLYLVTGCYACWYFIPLRWQRWLFTVLWFFPSFEMVYFLRPAHPYGEQMAFIAFSLVCFDLFTRSIKPVLCAFLFFGCTLTAIWISDFSLVFYVVLPWFFLNRLRIMVPGLLRRDQRYGLLCSFIVIAAGVIVLWYAKNHTSRDETYIDQLFSTKNQLAYTVTLLWQYTWNVISFQSISLFNSLMFYSTFIALVMLGFKRWQQPFTAWSLYFLCAASLSLLVLTSLRWVAINYVMLKYFIPAFLFMWLALFSVEPKSSVLKSVYAALLCISVVAAAGSGLWMHAHESRPVVNLEKLERIKTLEPTAFIGSYWSSYVLGIADPANIAATPRQEEFSRSPELLQKVLARDTVYFVRNDWFETFPDSIAQYGYTWIKTGDEITIDPFVMAPYVKRK